MAPFNAAVYRARSAGLNSFQRSPRVDRASASKSIRSPTALRACSRARVLAAPCALNQVFSDERTFSCVEWTAALAEPGWTAATIRATAMDVTNASQDVGRGGCVRASRWRQLSARGLLERCPGELRIIQRLEPLAVGARVEERPFQQLAGVAQPGVERHSGLCGELLSDLGLLAVPLDAHPRLGEIPERLLHLETDQLLGADVHRGRFHQIGLRLPEPRELLRDVEGALQAERHIPGRLVIRVEHERARGVARVRRLR